jgi:hypothetical protein
MWYLYLQEICIPDSRTRTGTCTLLYRVGECKSTNLRVISPVGEFVDSSVPYWIVDTPPWETTAKNFYSKIYLIIVPTSLTPNLLFQKVMLQVVLVILRTSTHKYYCIQHTLLGRSVVETTWYSTWYPDMLATILPLLVVSRSLY